MCNFQNIHSFQTIICKNYKKTLELSIQKQKIDLFQNFMIYFREIMEEYEKYINFSMHL